MVPGSDLLSIALTTINPQVIKYRKFAGRTLNVNRDYVDQMGEPFDMLCSVQRVQTSKYAELGLDLQKSYVKVFASHDLIDIGRDTSGDDFTWGGRRFKLTSNGNWFLMDGWATCIAVDVGPAPTPSPDNPEAPTP